MKDYDSKNIYRGNPSKDGRKIIIETGKLAKQAHGSVVVRSGKCMLLCTVVSNYNSAQVDFYL